MPGYYENFEVHVPNPDCGVRYYTEKKVSEEAHDFQATLCRPVTLFQESGDGILWADEVECLLDLHEARLESQALEFLERLTPKSIP